MRTECILPGQVELESSVEAESESVVVQAVHSGTGGGEEHHLTRDLLSRTGLDDQLRRRFAALLTV